MENRGVLIGSIIFVFGSFILMIGGQMNNTKAASVAIYDEMNKMNYDLANKYAIILLVISFILIVLLNFLTRKNPSDIA